MQKPNETDAALNDEQLAAVSGGSGKGQLLYQAGDWVLTNQRIGDPAYNCARIERLLADKGYLVALYTYHLAVDIVTKSEPLPLGESYILGLASTPSWAGKIGD